MEWFFIEAFVALAIGVAIVWWTMAPQRKSPRADETKSGAASDSKAGGAATRAARKDEG